MSNNAGIYLQRLVEDDYVHEQITEAVSRLHKAYRRADRKKGAKAAEDKELYEHVRAAAGSLRRAGTALQRKPPKPKHRGRKLLVAGAVAAGGAVVVRKLASAAGAAE
jgi:predicted Zn-ribbon and HTH transcriptional regulator